MNIIRNLLGSGLTRRLVFWLLVLALVPLLAGGLVAYLSSQSALEAEAIAKLVAVRDTKANQIEHYFDERLGDVQVLSANPSTVAAMRAFDEAIEADAETSGTDEVGAMSAYRSLYLGKPDLRDAGDGSDYSATHAQYHSVFKQYLEVYGYYDVLLVDPHSAVIVYSVFKEDGFGTSLRSGAYAGCNIGKAFQETVVTASRDFTMLEDFAYYEPSKGAASFVASPVFDGSELVGVLIFQLPIDQINAIMQERSGMGNSGETYLVGKDLLMRSDSRFSEESTIFEQKVDTEAVRSALNGVIGQQVIKDYRGTEVLSAFAPLDIEGVDWVIVAEIDSAEAFSSVQRLTWQMLLIALVAAIVVPVVATWIARSITRPIILLRDVAIALADGDLTQKVQVGARSKDEVSELGSALDAAIATWRGIIGGLRDDSARLSTTAAELANSSEELSRTASVLSDEISRTSTGMEEMATTIREVARSAELAAEASTASSERAHAGGELVSGTAVGLEQADEIMQRLRARSDEIGTIVNLIQEIAAQTNILALNAAIEAAGAGAAGARFDVVAEEIRQLAGRTSQATGEIAELIGAVQSDTQVAAEAISKGAAMAQESGASLTNIVEASASVNDMVQSISTSTEEQSRASEEIATSLDAMVGSSQQTATATRETAQIGIELSNLAERLKEAAGQFKV